MLNRDLRSQLRGPVVSFYQFLGHTLIMEGDQLCEQNQRGRLSRSYYAYWGKIPPVSLQRDEYGSYAPT